MESTPGYIVVIGTSAGGISALTELVMGLRPDTDASFFIVMHLSRKGVGTVIMNSLQQSTTMPCRIAQDDEPIIPGTIYIAPPDFHLLMDPSFKTILGRGPAENRWRPAINTLFRSAAASFGNKLVGIILTGLLDNGTAGMDAVKRAGGITIVQDPNEAEFPDMPLSVLNSMEVDYCAHLSEIPMIVHDIITTNKLNAPTEIPSDLLKEAEMSRKVVTSLPAAAELGEKSVYSCPDCGGGLWKLTRSNIDYYRCHIGHSFSETDLLNNQLETLESTLWVALRMMEERRNLLLQFYNKEVRKGLRTLAETHRLRAVELESHIGKLKELLFTTQPTS